MKIRAVVSVTAATLVAVSTAAAPKDDISQAIGKLTNTSYSWKQTSDWGGNFSPQPTTGKIDKDGTAVVTRTFQDNESKSVHQGEKAATQTQEGEWRSLAELEADQGEGRGRWTVMLLRSFQPPTEEAKGLLEHAKELSMKDGAYAAALTEEGAKNYLSFRRGQRGGDNQAPEISNASGSVKFWVQEGSLKKYEYSVSGTMSFQGQDRDLDRTTTVEITDVGTTKVEIPAEAKAKL
jgi:hypothetical protein